LLRNLHLSSIRRHAAGSARTVPIESFDSAQLALNGLDPEQRTRARDQLCRVCQYVCRRKAHSKAASVLALRFFLGFYPAEIGRILITTPSIVNRWLWQARAEAKRFLEDPSQLRNLSSTRGHLVALPSIDDPDTDAVVGALNAALFTWREGPCVGGRQIRKLYGGKGRDASITATWLAHLVSCTDCLDLTCGVLGLPPLDERYPSDPPTSPPTTGARSRAGQGRAQRRRRDVFEHRPKELRIAVNGLVLGELAVESAHNRIRWTMRLDEPLVFAEAHSEQGLRMAWLTITPPPDGDVRQAAQVELSDDRWLSLQIDFAAAQPAIVVEYVDPSLEVVQPLTVTAAAAGNAAHQQHVPEAGQAVARHTWRERLLAGTSVRRPLLAGLLAVALAAAGWWIARPPIGAPDAAAILEQAAHAELAAAEAGRAHHQVLRFQVRQSSAAAPARRYQLDVWTAAPEHAVRVSDSAGHTIAGHIRDATGREHDVTLGVFDDVWRAGLSARVFRERYVRPDAVCRATSSAAEMSVRCEVPARSSLLDVLHPPVLAAEPVRPSVAELTLRRPDLRATRLLLTIHEDGVDSHVVLEEERFDDVSMRDVPAGTFDPLPALSAPATASAPVVPTARLASVTSSLEVRVADLLDRLQDDDQLSVERMADGRLRVAGLVATAAKRRQVVAGVERFSATDTVVFDVATHAEALRRMPASPGRTSVDQSRVEIREVPSGPPAIAAHLAPVLTADAVAAVVRDLSPRVVAEARAARLQAAALRAFLDRFPEADAAALDADGRQAWRGVLSRRVAMCMAALRALDTLLAPYFAADRDEAVTAPASVTEAARRLMNETSVLDAAVSAAFTARDLSTTPAPEVSTDFRNHIQQASRDAFFIDGRIRP
jgi:hypothetical protein